MKSTRVSAVLAFLLILCMQTTHAQEIKNFPFDPYAIMKSWNYDFLIKTMGSGEEILATSNNQTYLAGLKYSFDFLSIPGKMEYYFTKDSISRFQFRYNHEVRVISGDRGGKTFQDRSVSLENKLAIQRLDSIQKRDSVSRDSLVRAISEILGSPLSNGRTAVTEKNARYSAIWITRGYSCLYKDYINYSEIIFTIATVPSWVVGEFQIPAGTQILQKNVVTTRKMTWTASLLGFPADARRMTYSDVFLLLEFTTGQKYLVSIPKSGISYLQTQHICQFGTGQRFLMSIPQKAITGLPNMKFEDCDGDAIPEMWIMLSSDLKNNQIRHYLYSLPQKEPNLIFSSDEQTPKIISFLNDSNVMVTLQSGVIKEVKTVSIVSFKNQSDQHYPRGFLYLNTTKLNNDGSTNFVGGIELLPSLKSSSTSILEITYKHNSGGWEAEQYKVLPGSN